MKELNYHGTKERKIDRKNESKRKEKETKRKESKRGNGKALNWRATKVKQRENERR